MKGVPSHSSREFPLRSRDSQQLVKHSSDASYWHIKEGREVKDLVQVSRSDTTSVPVGISNEAASHRVT